jgi:hypothetical protein
MTTTLNASTAGAGGFIATSDNSGVLALQTAGTTAITVDASQRVGIGTTSPTSTYRTSIKGDYSSIIGGVEFDNGGGDKMAVSFASATSPSFIFANQSSTGVLRFDTNATERMRIDSSGSLLINKTSRQADERLGITGNSGQQCAVLVSPISGDYDMINFRNTNGQVGRIGCNGTATSYITSSDYRLKENITPMTGALAKVAQLKPVTYKWKVNGSDGQGFIAHELAEVVPDCVSGEKDAIDANGDIQPQGIDTSFLVATLTAALQETKALLDTQAETINALTARIVALEGQ